jgi:flagellar biosynthesis protein FlhF
MQVHTFLAASVTDAVSQIRETLGPEAVVLNVRRLPAEGLARLWQKPRIEVLAHVPAQPLAPDPVATPPPDDVQISALAELRAEMRLLRDHIQNPAPASFSGENRSAAAGPSCPAVETTLPRRALNRAAHPTNPGDGEWRVGAFLENSGLLPVQAERIVEELRATYGEAAPIAFSEELTLARLLLAKQWRNSRPESGGPHVFIGAPGVGKTTALCKWLAQVALVEGRQAAVWRLDGHISNTAESLSVFSEILGVPVERFAPANGELPEADVWFVDLPGVNPNDANALAQLTKQISALPQAQVHLVLNAAYESSVLLAQLRAFAGLPVADVILTHLDEETRWGKVWNLVLGTNCTVRALSAGQNIPGDFLPATAEAVLSRQFPSKSAVLTP